MDDNKQSSVVSDKQSLPSNEGQSSDENTNEPVVEEAIPVVEEAKSSEPETSVAEEAAGDAAKSEVAKASDAVEPTPEVDESIQEEGAKPTSSDQTGSASDALQPDEQSAGPEVKETQDQSSDQNEETQIETTEEPAEKPSNDNPNAKWYVVHTYSGHENRVATTLRQRTESEHLEEKILDILVPTQDKIEIKSGKKVSVKEKIFPGYILVKMVLDDSSWLAVRTTQGVTSFVGIGNKPTPISESEVQTIVRFTKEEAPTYKQVFTMNDTVKIVDGPFAEFIGKVDHIDEERGKVKVLVSIFGRETPVELDFLQVTKI